MEIIHDDARVVLRDLPENRTFDVIFGDAFRDSAVPYQLTTREFDDLVAAHLRPGGMYVASIADGSHYDFLRSVIRTLRKTFPHVALLARSEALAFDGINSNFVVLASQEPTVATPATLSDADLETFMNAGRSVVLTDDYAPVEQLLAPTYR